LVDFERSEKSGEVTVYREGVTPRPALRADLSLWER
jgi:hypothetical protein